MNIYTWTFEPIEVSAAEIDGLEDVIKNVHWRITAISDDATPLSATAYGVVTLGDPDDNFVEFNSVSKEMIKAWTQAKADIEAEAIAADIAFKQPQDFNVKAKAAYVQTRMMFTWK